MFGLKLKKQIILTNNIEYVLYFNNVILFCILIDRDNKNGWLRIFNSFGLKWKHVDNIMLFSERNGYKKHITVNNYRIFILR